MNNVYKRVDVSRRQDPILTFPAPVPPAIPKVIGFVIVLVSNDVIDNGRVAAFKESF
jgi:hypothetical protein